MKTTFKHRFNIGDTVFLVFFSRGKYRVRKRSGYKVEMIRFCFYSSSPYSWEKTTKKSVYYWFENNPGVHMTEEMDCFDSLEEAEKYCNIKNEKLLK